MLTKKQESKNQILFELNIGFSFKVNGHKEILYLTSQVFLQLFLAVVITQINSFMFGWYDHQAYLAVVNKVTIFYTTFQFVPGLIASGVLVVGNNFLGQGKQKELSSLIGSGLIVSLIVCCFVTLMMNIFATNFLGFLEVSTQKGSLGFNDGSNLIIQPSIFTNHNQGSEMDFAVKYLRFSSIQLIFLGVAQVYIAALQTKKKQLHVALGAISSNVIDVLCVVLILYVIKLDPLYCSLAITLATIFQMIYMIGMSYKFIEYEEKNLFKTINLKYMVEITKIGLPITIEMGIWNICNFSMQAAISKATNHSLDLGESAINLHRGLWSLGQYSSTFLQAIGTVTSMLVARKIGENNIKGAYEQGWNCWKISLYAQLTLGLAMFGVLFPYLLILNIPRHQIISYAFLLYGLLFFKMLFDTVNLSILRALWSTGDVWYPIFVSIFTMGIFLASIPNIIAHTITPMLESNHSQSSGFVSFLLIYTSMIFDPLIRSIIYTLRWKRGTWVKHTRQI